MNIQEAKEEIIRTVQAYTARDETGCYRIPAVRQRPVLLMGPPGIGKTAIMEQAAKECQVGLAAYTITHHTRQSAVGLPQLSVRQYDGREYTVTEYTMSEIVGSIYEYMEQTGYREGLLFIDEINCVSETLAPTMLQFLQYKTFGNHRVPEGWVIVAAGNPSEFNQSVRELDMAALDRVRTIEVEADYAVWRDYAFGRGVHLAILSYLEMKPEHFYQVIQTREKREFVTARGWEDLSVILLEYERQGLLVTESFMAEFIRSPKIASDFASYYQLYENSVGFYRIPELLDGKLTKAEEEMLLSYLKEAKADVRCMFVRHLLAAASERMTALGKAQRCLNREKEVIGQLASYLNSQKEEKSCEKFLEQRAHALQVKREHGLLKDWEEQLEIKTDRELKKLLNGPGRREFLYPLKASHSSSDETLEAGLSLTDRQLEQQRKAVQEALGRASDFLIGAFGKDTEFFDWLYGIQKHGDFAVCGFDRPELAEFMIQREQEQKLQRQIKEMEELYEAADSI